MSLVLSKVDESIGTITLNHPEKRNALSEPLVHGIIEAFQDFKVLVRDEN
jgi:enoyl-CoA hydratase/carnithine racemase